VELEVGFGKGLFLLTAAQTRPDVNFAGVEIVRKYQLFTATRLARRGLHNLRVACADVRWFLPRCVAAASLDGIHVYFPDPWWKKRHHKRRVFTVEFVQECTRVLKPGGRFHAVTDVEDYARVMSDLLRHEAGLRELPMPAAREPEHDLDYLTNFERKLRKQGKPIFRMLYERTERAVDLSGAAGRCPS
jgi:tRNA (guanine-N7-)-methyltransferase